MIFIQQYFPAPVTSTFSLPHDCFEKPLVKNLAPIFSKYLLFSHILWQKSYCISYKPFFLFLKPWTIWRGDFWGLQVLFQWKKLGALFSKTMVATWPFKFCKYFQAEISQWMTSLWCRLLAHLNFFYSFETFPRIIFFWNSPNIIIFTSKAFNKNFALVGLDWWFAFWSNFSFLTSFILETSCLDERYIVGDSGNKQWIIDHLKNIGSIGCVWGNIRLTLKFLNLKFVQFIKIFFWYETLQLQKKKKAKYNLYTFEDHTSFSWILRQRQKWWLW